MYQGPERRRRFICVTKNSEYHFFDGKCVAVRNPQSGQWAAEHSAIGSKLIGTLAVSTHGTYSVSAKPTPNVGARLCFECDVLTGPVLTIRRPSENTVHKYRMLPAA